MTEETPAADPRALSGTNLRQYLVYNLGIWAGVAVIGFLLITGVRQYGSDLTARRGAGDLLAQARTLLDSDAVFECHRTVEEAIRLHPPAAAAAIKEFGPALIGLPLLRARLRAALETAPEAASPRAAAMLALLELPPDAALPALSEVRPQEVPEIHLWKGRVALDLGDIPAAARHFERHWSQARRDRAAAARTLLGERNLPEDARADAVRRLFHAGLWREAFAAVAEARQAGAEAPEFAYYEAVAIEIEEGPETARAAYEKALEAAPGHIPAMKRLHLLASEADPA